MPKRDTAPVGAPCWIDLYTSDTGKARAFYGEVFGWEAEDPHPEFGGYFNYTKDGVLIAGCMAATPGEGDPDSWSVYLTSDDTRKTLEVAGSNGGHVIVPAMDVGDLGTMGVMTDPGGGRIGVWQPKLHSGFGLRGEHGTPSWFELHTGDYDRSLAFYHDVFRWETQSMSDVPEFRYTTLTHGGEQLAGVLDASGFLPEGAPAEWSVYLWVDDTDASLAKITSLGGTVLRPAEDTPYGRLAAAADPMGARFKLMAANEAMPAQSAS